MLQVNQSSKFHDQKEKKQANKHTYIHRMGKFLLLALYIGLVYTKTTKELKLEKLFSDVRKLGDLLDEVKDMLHEEYAMKSITLNDEPGRMNNGIPMAD